MDLKGSDGQFSVTEKAIKDACDIAVALDTSKDVHNTELWPIFKVAVLVVDPKKENCYLEFGHIKEGVWSLVEKTINESKINADVSIEEVIGTKRKWNDPSVSTVDSGFQLGYDAVKDATDFGSSNLVVLETRVVYSVCNLKSAARFFIMQCSQSFSIKNQVPLKLLVERLYPAIRICDRSPYPIMTKGTQYFSSQRTLLKTNMLAMGAIKNAHRQLFLVVDKFYFFLAIFNWHGKEEIATRKGQEFIER